MHSVLGEATDHVTQSEVNEESANSELQQMDAALTHAQAAQKPTGGQRSTDPAANASQFTNAMSKIPGTGSFVQEAINLQAASDAQQAENDRAAASTQSYDPSYQPYGDYGGARADNAQGQTTFAAPPGSQGGPPGPGIPGYNANIDPQQAIAKIYPILVFRDKIVRSIASTVEKIPGLEKAIETISEKITLFIMGLLAPYVKPIIAAASNALKQGSGTVVSASAKQQYLVWQDPTSTDPTHSMLSKDHFSNILNSPSGEVASTILQYVAPRIIYGWDHPEVPEQEIFNDIARVFHHPALRDQNIEIQRSMFTVVEKWSRNRAQGAQDLNVVLSSESVKAGKNHVVQNFQQSVSGLEGQLQSFQNSSSSHSATAGGPLANFLGGGKRGMDFDYDEPGQQGGYGGGYPEGGPRPQDYAQASYNQPPPEPAGFAPGDVNAFPTAYQQGYEPPFDPAQQQQQYGGANQGYGQGGYGGHDQSQQGYGQGGGGYGRY